MDEKIVKIHGVESEKFAVVAGIDRANHCLVVLRSGPSVVLRFADQVFCEAGVELFVFGCDSVDDFFDQPELVALVENSEIIFIADLVGIAPEDADAQGMKRAGGELRGFIIDHRFDAFLHLSSGFVGEGHCKDLAGFDALGDQPGDAGDDRARFTCASASENEEGAGLMRGGALLFRIEVVEAKAAHGRMRFAKREITSG